MLKTSQFEKAVGGEYVSWFTLLALIFQCCNGVGLELLFELKSSVIDF